MSRDVTIQVYSYDELSDKAKRCVQNWYLETFLSQDWWDVCYDVIEELADIIGIDIHRRHGSRLAPPQIFFGLDRDRHLYFTGTFSYKPVRPSEDDYPALSSMVDFIEAHPELIGVCFDIAVPYRSRMVPDGVDYQYCDDWEDFVREHGIEVDEDGAPVISPEVYHACQGLLDTFKDAALSILEKEYEFLTSEEIMSEILQVNGYMFLENGEYYAC